MWIKLAPHLGHILYFGAKFKTNIFFVTKFQSHGSETWSQPFMVYFMYKAHSNKENQNTCDLFVSCAMLLLSCALQKVQHHVHTCTCMTKKQKQKSTHCL